MTARVYHGDCLDVLRGMPDASVDAVVTDPPYGLEFMGKEWDGADGFRRSLNRADVGRDSVYGRTSRTSPEYRAGSPFQAWCEAWAAECLRVLKPGGHLLAFGGSRTWHRLAAGIEDAGFEMRDSIAWLYASGFPKSRNLDGAWQGWGTALKPAFEPIVVARKPLAGTVAANVTTHGTGALNIDATRVKSADALVRPAITRTSNDVLGKGLGAGTQVEPAGRWPSNLVLTHAATPDGADHCHNGCVDGCPVRQLDQQSGTLTSGKLAAHHQRAPKDAGILGAYGSAPGERGYGDTGGASRFFPTFRYQAKAPAKQRPKIDGVAHPTVKPLALMEWLCRLVTPPGGTILDLFAGSGTTGEAAHLAGYDTILIESGETYLPLIAFRLNRVGAPHDTPEIAPTPQSAAEGLTA